MLKQPNLIKEKVKLLADIGMTDKEAVKAYFVKETINITDQTKLEMKLDRLARTMITDFFDGDKQFVLTPKRKDK